MGECLNNVEIEKWFEQENKKEELKKEFDELNKQEEAKRLTNEAFKMLAKAVELVRG